MMAEGLCHSPGISSCVAPLSMGKGKEDTGVLRRKGGNAEKRMLGGCRRFESEFALAMIVRF
jgi:hypothetical protein